MDVANQLADGLASDAPQQIENGKLDGGQWRADGYSVVPEIESIDKNLFQQPIQVPRIFAEKERPEVMMEDRVKCVKSAMTHGYALRPAGRTHAAQEIIFVPEQFKGFDDYRIAK